MDGSRSGGGGVCADLLVDGVDGAESEEDSGEGWKEGGKKLWTRNEIKSTGIKT